MIAEKEVIIEYLRKINVEELKDFSNEKAIGKILQVIAMELIHIRLILQDSIQK